MSSLNDLFDVNGDCVASVGDPFRHMTADASRLFDNDGFLAEGVEYELVQIIADRKAAGTPVDVMSDIVGIIHAERFAQNTKGSYSTIYRWR